MRRRSRWMLQTKQTRDLHPADCCSFPVWNNKSTVSYFGSEKKLSYITFITLYATFQLLSYSNPNNDLFLHLTERFSREMSATDICQSTDSVVAVWRCAHAADISVLFFCVHRWWAHCVSSTAGQDGVINKKSYERLKKKQCDLDLEDNRQQRARNRKATECTTAAVFSHRRQQDDSKRELEDQIWEQR